LAGAFVLLAVLWRFAGADVVFESDRAATDLPAVRVEVAPVAITQDLGPEFLVGQTGVESSGTNFGSVDLTVRGTCATYRLYFDYRNASNFHFLDRTHDRLALGLSEAGVEQIFADAPASDVPNSVRLARHGPRMGVFQDGRLVCAAFDDRLAGGAAGWRRGAEGELIVAAQPFESIRFADDFMREDNLNPSWEVHRPPTGGDFRIQHLRHPILSANAFFFLGSGKGSIALVHHARAWDHYRFEVALWGPEASRVGLVFAYRDERNYGLFRWSARVLSGGQGEDHAGRHELVLVRDGVEEILAAHVGGYLPCQWYRAEVLLTYASLRVLIDGHLFFEHRDAALVCGAPGLWCDVEVPKVAAPDPLHQPLRRNGLWELMKDRAAFDDVKVESVERLEDHFAECGPLRRGWLAGPGTWNVSAAEPGVLAVKNAPQPARALIGDRRWRQYEVRCEALAGAGQAGLVFLYRDDSDHYALSTDGRSAQLVRVANGRRIVLDAAAFPETRPGRYVPLKVSVVHGHIRAEVAGAVLECFEDRPNCSGRAGLFANGGLNEGAARFKKFVVEFLQDTAPLVTTNAVFEDESLMQSWTGAESGWYTPVGYPQTTADGREAVSRWHRCLFPEDVELTVEPRSIQAEQHEIALAVAKDGRGLNNGYVFRYQAGQPEGGKLKTVLSLLRQGQSVATRTLDEPIRELAALSLRRAGAYVVGTVNGKPEIAWRDAAPLPGMRVAYLAQGIEVRTEAARLTSDNLHDEWFARAPAGWRRDGNSIAEVTNRWVCDSRWSFFSLGNNLEQKNRGKAAVLWSKTSYPGDVAISFWSDCKMDDQRGKDYQYARDLNLTICSDGNDLTKGYTFMFGGFDNRGTMILRDGKVVKECPLRFPRNNNHHHNWYAFRVEKRGNRLTYSVDQFFREGAHQQPEGEMVFVDDLPLTGSRIALWTYDNAIMLSRVVISGTRTPQLEDPRAAPRELKTVYEP